jgi:hypothetical protein
MNYLNNIHFLAQAGYNCDAYGANAYGECSTASTTAPAPSGGLLADTGYNVLLPLALGLSIVIASLILLFKTLRRRQQKH